MLRSDRKSFSKSFCLKRVFFINLKIPGGDLGRVYHAPFEDFGVGEELLLVVLDGLNGVALASLARHHCEVAQGLHGEELAGQDLLDAGGVGQVLLGQVHFGQDEDGPLA